MKTIATVLVLLLFVSCKEEKLAEINVPNYAELTNSDVKLSMPKEGSWLKQHEEKGQTFEQYIAEDPVKISEKRNTIYLQPIGEFTPDEKKMVDFTAEYVGYFFGLRTVLLEPVSADMIPKEKKRIHFDAEQFDASYIIYDVLPDEIPSDGIVIRGLTATDLYPKPDWNYVFGLASYSKGSAVTSMFRFKDSVVEENYSLCLSRLIKTSTHEITHMFTVAHCINGVCLMNGSNHIAELDESPNALCSVCLAKLSWNLEFDNIKRMEKMIAFCKQHKLDSDADVLQKQYDILKNKN
ncbi:archaemetzincin [Flavobacterium terrisoli]|uniref:archaemetzincin n=1 Tax=Flavobacterium terrisoli TaxID=3242195 RepID=UPI00254354C4|nr:archaemetzincin [Flavobacterium buctense]